MKASIILEGYDGAGKSSLAKYLSDCFNMPIETAGPPARDDKHAMDCCHKQMVAARHGYILDRVTPISRLCYQEGLTFTHITEMSRYMTEMIGVAVIVWCKPKEYKHERSSHDTDEHLADIESRQTYILDNYEAMMKTIPHITYDWATDNRVKLMDEIRRLMK